MMSLTRPTRPMLFTASLVFACSLTLTGGVTNLLHAANESSASSNVELPAKAESKADSKAESKAESQATSPASPAAAPEVLTRKPPRGVVINPPDLNRTEPLPKEMQNVGVAEHRGDQLPMDLRFTNENGKEVRLGDLITGDRPVILDLGYYSCPMLCDLVMNGLCDTIKDMKWVPGEDYQIIFVSIDPTENYKLAASKKKTYVDDLNDAIGANDGSGKVSPLDESSWHFLTGDQDNIAALSQAIGFAYQWDQRQMQYAHPAVLTILTPQGKISRYIYGVKFPERTLKLSLVEASEGKIGSALDQLILTCFHYDPLAGSYTLKSYMLMRAGGYLTVLVVGGVIGFALLREQSRKRNSTDRGAPKSL